MNIFDLNNHATFLAKLVVIFLVLPLIKYFTCLVACKLGDDTPEMLKKLTLNPLVHLDIMGAVLMLLTGIGWSKPLPMNPSNFYKAKNKRIGCLFVTLAGPLANFIFAFLILFIASLLSLIDKTMSMNIEILKIFNQIAFVMITISLFYLLPLPGFAGEAILKYFAPNTYEKLMPYRHIIFIISLLFMCFGFFGTIFRDLAIFILVGFQVLCDNILNLFIRGFNFIF